MKLVVFGAIIWIFMCGTCASMTPEEVASRISVPGGFHVSVFSDQVPYARSLAIGDSGTVFVGTRRSHKVYALKDTNSDGIADQHHILSKGLNIPNGVAFLNGDLYVAELGRVICYRGVESSLEEPPDPDIINNFLPDNRIHGWKYLRFGPDKRLYISVGIPSIENPFNDIRYGTIFSMNPDGTDLEPYAAGVHHSMGFDWHPETKDMWFTDTGRAFMGDNLPPDELNHAEVSGLHFGFPWLHGKRTKDPRFKKKPRHLKIRPAHMNLDPHVSASGICFYTGAQFPPHYKSSLFIVEYGSDHRSTPVGGRVMQIKWDKGQIVSSKPFATG